MKPLLQGRRPFHPECLYTSWRLAGFFNSKKIIGPKAVADNRAPFEWRVGKIIAVRRDTVKKKTGKHFKAREHILDFRKRYFLNPIKKELQFF